jgi:hypothetical protein
MDPLNVLIEKLVAEYQEKSGGNTPSSDWLTSELLNNHRDKVMAWVERRLESIVHNQAVTKKLGAIKSRMINQVRRSMLSGNVELTESVMNTPYWVPSVGWKTVGRLTGHDHAKIANMYNDATATMQARAFLHAALAEEVGSRTTEEVFKPQELINRLKTAYDDGVIPKKLEGIA